MKKVIIMGILAVVVLCGTVMGTLMTDILEVNAETATAEESNLHQPQAETVKTVTPVTKTPTLEVRDSVIDIVVEEAVQELSVVDSFVSFPENPEAKETVLSVYTKESSALCTEVTVAEDTCETEVAELTLADEEVVEEIALEAWSVLFEAEEKEEAQVEETNSIPCEVETDSFESQVTEPEEIVLDTLTDAFEATPVVEETPEEETVRSSEESIAETDIREEVQTENNIVAIAESMVGVTPYVNWWDRMDENGMITNSFESGTDCSGFVSLVYAEAGISVPTGSDAYQEMSNTTYDELEPGDIVVYRNGGHVGIYAGDDTIIHCSNEDEGTKISNMFYDEPTGYVHVEN